MDDCWALRPRARGESGPEPGIRVDRSRHAPACFLRSERRRVLGLPGRSRWILPRTGSSFPATRGRAARSSQKIGGLDQTKGRWISFRFRGLAEDGFSVPDNSLKMKIEFYAKNGTEYMDCASRPIYSEIERDRQEPDGQRRLSSQRRGRLAHLRAGGTAAVSRCRCGADHRRLMTRAARRLPTDAAFLIDDFSLVQRTRSLTGRVDPAERIPAAPTADVARRQQADSAGRPLVLRTGAGRDGRSRVRSAGRDRGRTPTGCSTRATG